MQTELLEATLRGGRCCKSPQATDSNGLFSRAGLEAEAAKQSEWRARVLLRSRAAEGHCHPFGHPHLSRLSSSGPKQPGGLGVLGDW